MEEDQTDDETSPHTSPMTYFDAVNAAFEGLGLLFIVPNVVRLHRFRDSRNIHPSMPVFFWLWGMWNVLYYPALGQYYSALCGVGVLVANTAYLHAVYRYRNGAQE